MTRGCSEEHWRRNEVWRATQATLETQMEELRPERGRGSIRVPRDVVPAKGPAAAGDPGTWRNPAGCSLRGAQGFVTSWERGFTFSFLFPKELGIFLC